VFEAEIGWIELTFSFFFFLLQLGMNFDSAGSVDAAMMRREADSMQWGDTSLLVKIGLLEAEWKAVE
jgi:hypothetical protein